MQPPDVRTEVERVLDRGPSRAHQRRIEAEGMLRRLASRGPSGLPVVSAYLDLRPPGDATDPAVRQAAVIVRDRLGELSATVPKHGRPRESFDADAERVMGELRELAAQGERGLAVFTCHGEGLLEQLRTWEPFEPRVEAGPRPFLPPLARFVDYEASVVALADTNSLRLFVSEPGRLEEVPSIDDPSFEYRKRSVAGHPELEHDIDEHRHDFARRAAELIAKTIEIEDGERLILAGNEEAVTELRDALPKATEDLVRETLHLDRTSFEAIEDEALPVIARLEADDARDAADRLVDAVRSEGLGVAGLDSTRRALEIGEGLELLVDEGGSLADEHVDELIRLAVGFRTRVTFVPGHAGLRELGGVGALLRFRA